MKATTQVKAAPGIRLAAPTQPGAALYNSYHYLTQLAGLYAEAGQHDQHKDAALLWRELADLALFDLGEVYQTWEDAARTQKTVPFTESEKLGASVVRACERVERLGRLLDAWTPAERWARILLLCEQRFTRFLERFKQQYPGVDGRVGALYRGSLDRAAKVAVAANTYRKERMARNAQYAVADRLLRKGEVA